MVGTCLAVQVVAFAQILLMPQLLVMVVVVAQVELLLLLLLLLPLLLCPCPCCCCLLPEAAPQPLVLLHKLLHDLLHPSERHLQWGGHGCAHIMCQNKGVRAACGTEHTLLPAPH